MALMSLRSLFAPRCGLCSRPRPVADMQLLLRWSRTGSDCVQRQRHAQTGRRLVELQHHPRRPRLVMQMLLLPRRWRSQLSYAACCELQSLPSLCLNRRQQHRHLAAVLHICAAVARMHVLKVTMPEPLCEVSMRVTPLEVSECHPLGRQCHRICSGGAPPTHAPPPPLAVSFTCSLRLIRRHKWHPYLMGLRNAAITIQC